MTASPMVLTTAPASAATISLQHLEMRPHHVEGDEIADPLVELGRAAQIGEQEGQAGDLQPLIDVERIGPVEVAERLVGEQPLGGEERPPLPSSVQRLPGDEHASAGRASRCGSPAQCAAVRAASPGSGSEMLAVDDQRQRLPFAGRLALDLEKLHANASPARRR